MVQKAAWWSRNQSHESSPAKRSRPDSRLWVREAYRVQRGSRPHVREETHLQHMEQEILVVDTIDSVQEQNHGSLVVGHKTR